MDEKILQDLRDADSRGVCPPQNWTTRAADEIERLLNRIRELEEGLGVANTAMHYMVPDRELSDSSWQLYHDARQKFRDLYNLLDKTRKEG